MFPAQLSVAAFWDHSLAHLRGRYMCNEFHEKGAHVALRPVVGPLGRSAYGGRNWESFGPDAYISQGGNSTVVRVEYLVRDTSYAYSGDMSEGGVRSNMFHEKGRSTSTLRIRLKF
jgi:hypothetical protein